MVTEVALATFQRMTELPPGVMQFGVAVKRLMIGGMETLTVACACEEPPSFEAISV